MHFSLMEQVTYKLRILFFSKNIIYELLLNFNESMEFFCVLVYNIFVKIVRLIMNNSWNLDRLKKQAIGNQNFDDYVLNKSGILEYDDLKVLDIGCSN